MIEHRDQTGWDDPLTARAYHHFNRTHTRYVSANRVLAHHAGIAPTDTVLDFAAGTGGTAEAALPYLGATGRILCVEPASAMRAVGMVQLRDPRVTWDDALPDGHRFDRVICGAAIWQCRPLDMTLARLAAALAPGGVLCFNIPAAYVGEADPPGGGRDPHLTTLMAQLSPVTTPATDDRWPVPSTPVIDEMLERSNLTVTRWSMRTRFTQAAYRDWIKIPVINHRLLPHTPLAGRNRLIDAAYERVDPTSWRWERWLGWTAKRSG